jgi:preprotein translocase subunit YajC
MLFLAADAPQTGGTALILTMVPWLLFIFFFYWLFVAGPMRKKQKAFDQLMKNLKAGDKIVTNSGMHGVVTGLQDKTLQIRIANNVVVTMDRSAIAGLEALEPIEEKKTEKS